MNTSNSRSFVMEEGQSNFKSTPNLLKNGSTNTDWVTRIISVEAWRRELKIDPIAVCQPIKDSVWNPRPSLVSFHQDLRWVEDFIDLAKAFPKSTLTHANFRLMNISPVLQLGWTYMYKGRYWRSRMKSVLIDGPDDQLYWSAWVHKFTYAIPSLLPTGVPLQRQIRRYDKQIHIVFLLCVRHWWLIDEYWHR